MAAASAAAAGRGAVVPGKRECMALLGVLLAVAALAGPAAAAEYKVGGAIGWTTMGSPNYTAWALSKTFRVGDTIVFEYNNNFHNVLEVSRSNYDGCNAANPISTHTTGKDSIALKTAGHHYFICGIPTHCSLSGQKVDVNVLSSSSPSTPAPAAAAEYKVGDAIGWTIMGSPNYTAWALSKTFRVGDTIVFEYNNNFHNVLEVSRSNYDGCNPANPISTHTTGNDSIALKTAGHHYFICGFPGHCSEFRQKVDVNVLSSSSSSTPAPAPAPASSTKQSAPAPASSSTPAAPSVPSAASSPPPSPASGAPPSPKSAASPSVGSGHYLAGCAVALLAAAMSLSL